MRGHEEHSVCVIIRGDVSRVFIRGTVRHPLPHPHTQSYTVLPPPKFTQMPLFTPSSSGFVHVSDSCVKRHGKGLCLMTFDFGFGWVGVLKIVCGMSIGRIVDNTFQYLNFKLVIPVIIIIALNFVNCPKKLISLGVIKTWQ